MGPWSMSRIPHRVSVLAGISMLLFAMLLSYASVAVATDSRWIVVLRNGVPDAVAAEHTRDDGIVVEYIYRSALSGYAARIPERGLRSVRADPRVLFVQPDQRFTTTQDVPVAPGEQVPTGVRRIAAATTTTAHPAAEVGVAVIDTGISLSHPDISAVNGINCIAPENDANDDHGHGSHVAGIIAARNSGVGVIGVAPGTTVQAVKVLGPAGAGTLASVLCGVDWVTANSAALNIKVANMSIGASGTSDTACGATNSDALHRAICVSTQVGVTYVVAAGNSADRFVGLIPASYPEVLTVTAMADSDGSPGGSGGPPGCRRVEQDDWFARFSSFAETPDEIAHTIAAPGVCILSTWLGQSYTVLSGTSMSSPHVAGAVALCLTSRACSGPPAQVIRKIRAIARRHAQDNPADRFVGSPWAGSAYYGYLVYAGS